MPSPLNRGSLKSVTIIDAASPTTNKIEIPFIVDVGTWVPYHRPIAALHRNTDGTFADLPASKGDPVAGQLNFTSKDIAYWNSTGLVDVSPWEIMTLAANFIDNVTPVVGASCSSQCPAFAIALEWEDCDNAGASQYEIYGKAVWSPEGGKSVSPEGNLINWQVQLLEEPTFSPTLPA